ncbi:hypothetical protein [Deinococcus yavapaiensis]|uniref:Plastocyanin n=1 Tax=Deinococcus yavapaiensis KR-236 TaxID=694435 RepID=A0A318S9N8_9DEIO|nr:hypothetical protein [Deinococcus yavapaiensis]PYE55445.1 plastocyanin [Deinococcus yavapaiensis KR-236]
MNQTKKTMRTRLTTLLAAAMLATPSLAFAHDGHPMTVDVQSSEYKFTSPDSIPAGWTTLTLTNTGKEAHHVQVVRLPDGMNLQGFLAKLKENEGAALAMVDMIGGVGMLLPGQSQKTTVNFTKPGTYAELCFVPDEKGVPHLAIGMTKALTVTAAQTAAATEPTASFTVRLLDYGIELPKGVTVKAGVQTWKIVNAGPEAHEMAIMRMAPGKTMADVEAFFKNPVGPMPFIPAGGAQGMSAGRQQYAEFNLTEGQYILLCFIPSPTHQGAPHAMLGMVRPFTVVK